MRISLVRAWAGRHELCELELPTAACVDDALRAAGWGLDAEFVGVAVFGLAASADTVLHEGDRIELLRPLRMDPKQARRLRAERAKERSTR